MLEHEREKLLDGQGLRNEELSLRERFAKMKGQTREGNLGAALGDAAELEIAVRKLEDIIAVEDKHQRSESSGNTTGRDLRNQFEKFMDQAEKGEKINQPEVIELMSKIDLRSF